MTPAPTEYKKKKKRELMGYTRKKTRRGKRSEMTKKKTKTRMMMMRCDRDRDDDSPYRDRLCHDPSALI